MFVKSEGTFFFLMGSLLEQACNRTTKSNNIILGYMGRRFISIQIEVFLIVLPMQFIFPAKISAYDAHHFPSAQFSVLDLNV